MLPRRPLDIINAAAVCILLVLVIYCAVLYEGVAQWAGLIVLLCVMAVGVGAMAWLARSEMGQRPVVEVIVNFYPLLLIPVIFDNLGRIILVVSPVERDGLLIAADRAMFGVSPSIWLEHVARPCPWLTDIFHIAYCTYYPLAAAVGITLWIKDKALARRFIFSIVLAYYVSYAGYFLVPARGPAITLDYLQSFRLDQFVGSPISHFIHTTIGRLEHTKHDVFPSGHTLIAVMCMIAALRYFRPLWGRLIAVIATMLIISTFYCRFHYVVDVLAGALLGVVLTPLGARLYRRMGGV